MNIQDKQKRLAELTEALAYQERLLNIGSDMLLDLNRQYDELEREYKRLLFKKNVLTEDIITLTQNLDLYSNL